MGAREDFTAFVERREAALVRLAWALTGNRASGEDLAQATLARLWPRWPKVSATGDPWPYTQRIAVSLASTWRRRRSWGEVVTNALPDRPAPTTDSEAVLSHAVVTQWLSALPPRQRSVILLRFLADLSVDDTAVVLDCSTGTVKSQTAKALVHLRNLAGPNRTLDDPAQEGTGA